MTDEEGVLGNLPSSRPGRRSAKRERPAKAAEKAALKAEEAAEPAAAPPRAKRTSAKPRRAAAGASRGGRTTAVKGGPTEDGVRVMHDMDAEGGHDSANLRESPGDPVSAAVRTAASLAATGVKVAGAVTQELLRRLPRP